MTLLGHHLRWWPGMATGPNIESENTMSTTADHHDQELAEWERELLGGGRDYLKYQHLQRMQDRARKLRRLAVEMDENLNVQVVREVMQGADPSHLLDLFPERRALIMSASEAYLTLAGTYTINITRK